MIVIITLIVDHIGCEIMKRNIIFIGSMGSGKSHIGRNLAEHLNWQFVDTDRYLEKQYGKPIAEIYEQLGEKSFRKAEMNILKRVSLYHEAVISFGGNFLIDAKTIHALRKHSYIIVLQASEKRIVKRVLRRIGKRPTMNYDDVAGFVSRMMRDWRPIYKQCDFKLDTTFGESDALVEKVVKNIEKDKIVFKKRKIKEGRNKRHEKDSSAN